MKAAEIWTVLKQTVTDWLDDKAPKLAAALALYTMMSIGPLLVIVLKVIGVVYKDGADEKARSVLSGVLPSEAAVNFAVEAAHHAGKPGEGLLATVLSACLLAFTATGVFGELQDSLNTIWEVKPKPNQGIVGMLKNRLFSFAAVLGIAFLFMVSTVGTTVVAGVGKYIFGGNAVIAFVLTAAMSLVVMTGLFAMIFKLLPDVRIKWKDVILGAALTAVLFEVGKAGLSWYLGRASTTSVYGTAGSLAVLLLYIYYSAQILFFGAEFTQVYSREYGSGIHPTDYAQPVTDRERANLGLKPGVRGGADAPAPVIRVVTPPRPPMPAQPVVFGLSGLSAGLLAGAAGVWMYKRSQLRPDGRPKRTLADEVHLRLDRLEDEAREVDRAFVALKRLEPRVPVPHAWPAGKTEAPTLREALVRFVDNVRSGFTTERKRQRRRNLVSRLTGGVVG